MYQLIEGDISWNFRLLFSSHRMCRSSALALFCLCSTRPFPRGDNSFSLSSRHNERLQPAPRDHLIDVMWFKLGWESSWVYSAISVLQKCPNHFPLIWYQSIATRRMRRSSHTELQVTYLISTQIGSSLPRQPCCGQRGQPSKISTWKLYHHSARTFSCTMLKASSVYARFFQHMKSTEWIEADMSECKWWDHRRCNQVRVNLS